MADCKSSDDEGNAGGNDSDSQRCTSDVGAVGLFKNSKRKRKDPKFVDSWLEVKKFRGWLAKRRGTDGKVKPYCKICLLEINLTKTGISGTWTVQSIEAKYSQQKAATIFPL